MERDLPVDSRNLGSKLRPHKDLESIDWRGREVIIVFDASLVKNPLVALGAAGLAILLQGLGAKVRLAEIPYFIAQDLRTSSLETIVNYAETDQGPDDYLARNGVDAMRARITEARPAEPLEMIRAAVVAKQPVRSIVESLYVRAYLYEAGPAMNASLGELLKSRVTASP